MTDGGKDKGMLIGRGFVHEQLQLGFRYYTGGRTVTETDLMAFVYLSGLCEENFINTSDELQRHRPIKGRFVPGMLVCCLAEGLLLPSMQFTGLAFIETTINVLLPTVVGDTIHVECEVIESRPTKKPNRGLVRTRNQVVNQRGEVVLTYSPLRMVAGKDHV